MIWLILAILASFSISMLVKSNEAAGAQTQVVLAANYIVCALFGAGFVLIQGWPGLSWLTVLLSLGGGLLWIASFYMLMWGVRTFGVALVGSVSRLSLSVPVLFAVLFLHETLSLPMSLGIAVTFVAFYLLSPLDKTSGQDMDRRALWFFPLLVFVFGLTDGWVNLYNSIAPTEERFVFVALIFITAGILCWSIIAARKIKPARESLIRGAILGVPNYFSTHLLLAALRAPLFDGHSAVVYALYSVLGICLAFTAGALLWKEKVNRRNVFGLFTAIAAIVLLNLG